MPETDYLPFTYILFGAEKGDATLDDAIEAAKPDVARYAFVRLNEELEKRGHVAFDTSVPYYQLSDKDGDGISC